VEQKQGEQKQGPAFTGARQEVFSSVPQLLSHPKVAKTLSPHTPTLSAQQSLRFSPCSAPLLTSASSFHCGQAQEEMVNTLLQSIPSAGALTNSPKLSGLTLLQPLNRSQSLGEGRRLPIYDGNIQILLFLPHDVYHNHGWVNWACHHTA
jgi:hypothetical protein